MTSTVKLIPAEDLPAFTAIVANAYPSFGLNTAEARERYTERLRDTQHGPQADVYGLYRDEQLLGGMRFLDFRMTVFETTLAIGGLGMVAVDLLHKKEHVAKDMVAAFLRHNRERGVSLVALYPFRPDFYRQMGFGYGSNMHQFRFKPSSLPRGPKHGLSVLAPEHAADIAACHNRYGAATHGMIERSQKTVQDALEREEVRAVGFREAGTLRGYTLFRFQPSVSFLQNDIHVDELVYEHPAARAALFEFFRTQADQAPTIIFNTPDDSFHHFLTDPRNDSDHMIPFVYHESHTTGVGLMYRVVDTAALFRGLAEHNFNGQTCTVCIDIADDFLPENNGAITVAFEAGRARLADGGAHNVAISLGIEAFSSLVMGVVPFARLHEYGQASISDVAYVSQITSEKPVCYERF